MTTSSKPVLVLVHGALTDASVWSAVISQLQQEGYRVVAPALPMRGLASDGAYLASILATIDDDVVLVGHSYAGAVISHAPQRPGQVRAAVYIAAFQPDTGEAAGELNARFPGSLLGPDTMAFLTSPSGTDLYLKPEHFRAVYAADVSPATTAVMAATQRPVDLRAMEEALAGEPLWRSVPTWSLVSTDDLSIPPAALRFMAARAGSTVVEVKSSHAVPVSQPHAVTALILKAAQAR